MSNAKQFLNIYYELRQQHELLQQCLNDTLERAALLEGYLLDAGYKFNRDESGEFWVKSE